MTHDELLAKFKNLKPESKGWNALRAVVELHRPRTDEKVCIHCSRTVFWMPYPCPTIQAIEKELR